MGVPPTVTIINGPGASEFRITTEQAQALGASCMGAALGKLSLADRANLVASIKGIKTQISASLDLLYARQQLIWEQIQQLSDEKNSLDANSNSFANFYALMTPAIEACTDAQDMVTSAHAAIQPSQRQSTELGYKLVVANAKYAAVQTQIISEQSALNALGRAEYIIS